MQDVLKKIIKESINAPSGENVQPWRFVIKGDEIKLYNIPERDESLYNWEQKGSYISHGALITNMKIAAENFGYTLQANIFPTGEEKNLVAILTLIEGSDEKEKHFFNSIKKRVTNRKPYIKERLSKEAKKEILKSAASITGIDVVLTDNDEEMEQCAKLCSTNEEVMLQNKNLHHFFFSHINWTKEENEKRKLGFYIKTLELPKPVEGLFKIIKHWNIIKLMNKFGFAKNVGKQNALVYVSAAVFGVILIPDLSKENFLKAGEVLEKIWLTCTELKLYLQPFGGAPFMHLIIQAKETHSLSKESAILIKERSRVVEKLFNAEDKIMVMLFRIGKAEPPSARAIRIEPIISEVAS